MGGRSCRAAGLRPVAARGLRDDVRLHQVDLADAEAVEQVVAAARPRALFHLAAHGAYSWQTDADRILATNIAGTLNVLEASLRHGCEAFVNTGSSSEYGFKDHAPAEDEVLEPNSVYAVAKAAGTMLVRHVGATSEARVSTLRLYSVYGPEEPRRLMPTLVRARSSGRPAAARRPWRRPRLRPRRRHPRRVPRRGRDGDRRRGLQRRQRRADHDRRARRCRAEGVLRRGRAGVGVDGGAKLGHDELPVAATGKIRAQLAGSRASRWPAVFARSATGWARRPTGAGDTSSRAARRRRRGSRQRAVEEATTRRSYSRGCASKPPMWPRRGAQIVFGPPARSVVGRGFIVSDAAVDRPDQEQRLVDARHGSVSFGGGAVFENTATAPS